jgi:lysine biosynthesis protein LysW
MPKVICPECGAEIDIDAKTEEGTLIECPECGTELEVVRKGSKFDVELVEERAEDQALEEPDTDSGGEYE